MIKNCIQCNKEFNAFKASKYCSEECKTLANIKIKNCVVCNKEHQRKYGVTCSEKCQVIYTKNIFKEKTGFESPFQNPEVKAKIIVTNNERYGCDNPSQNNEIKLKKEQTSLKNYGVKNPSQSQVVLDKIKVTNNERYGCDWTLQNSEVIIKREKTCERIYGVKNVFQNVDIQSKIISTNNDRYGCNYPLQNDDIKNKVNITNIKKYGKNRFTQTQEGKHKIAETNLERYGESNVSKLQEVKCKMRESNIKKYGVPYHQLKHITNYENFNESFIRENFTTNGIATLNNRLRFREYFNISSDDNALKKLKELKINCELSLNASLAEKQILNVLKESFKHLTFVENDRTTIINSYTNKFLEIDILVKKNDKIICGIEYNGRYWHDEAEYFEGMSKEEYKTKECGKLGLLLFHIWEDNIENDLQRVIEYLKTVS